MDQPWDVQVTLIEAPRQRLSRGHVTGLLVVITLAVAGVGAVLAGEPRTSSTGGLEAAYRYPLGCLGDSLSGSNRAAAAHGTSPCWRYGVYVTAILRRVRGTWGLALEAVSPSCPAVSLPALVRAQLAVCVRGRAG